MLQVCYFTGIKLNTTMFMNINPWSKLNTNINLYTLLTSPQNVILLLSFVFNYLQDNELFSQLHDP